MQNQRRFNRDHEDENEADEYLRRERNRLDILRVRRRLKDVVETLENSPASFPHKAELIRGVTKILDLVPPVNAQDEAQDEAERRLPPYLRH